MNARSARACGLIGSGGALWDVEPVLFRFRRFLDNISPFHLTRLGGGGSGHEPEGDGRPDDDRWNDPALWMLMMH